MDTLVNENIICFAGEDWWYFNPHSNLHIMKGLARKNRILFVNSTGLRMPSISRDKFFWKRVKNKLQSMLRYLRKADKNIYVLTPLAFPVIARFDTIIEPLNRFLLNIQFTILLRVIKFDHPFLWVCSPSTKDLILKLKEKSKGMVYYCTDNIKFFSDDQGGYIDQLSIDTQIEADVALFVNREMVEERKKHNPHTYYLGHGVDFELFAKAQSTGMPIPHDIEQIKRPIIGYMGALRGIDFELVKHLASKFNEYSFVFVGDVYMDLAESETYANVHFLGNKEYEELPYYLSQFDCLCLYYDMEDEFNSYRNPKKLMEYLATGKPVVSVPIKEVRHFSDYVRIGNNYAEFAKEVQEAVERDSDDERQRRIELASKNTWQCVVQNAERRLRLAERLNDEIT